jgi:hypothetical protein
VPGSLLVSDQTTHCSESAGRTCVASAGGIWVPGHGSNPLSRLGDVSVPREWNVSSDLPGLPCGGICLPCSGATYSRDYGGSLY